MYVRSFPAFGVRHPPLAQDARDNEYGEQGDASHAADAHPQDEGRDAVTLARLTLSLWTHKTRTT